MAEVCTPHIKAKNLFLCDSQRPASISHAALKSGVWLPEPTLSARIRENAQYIVNQCTPQCALQERILSLVRYILKKSVLPGSIYITYRNKWHFCQSVCAVRFIPVCIVRDGIISVNRDLPKSLYKDQPLRRLLCTARRGGYGNGFWMGRKGFDLNVGENGYQQH